VLNYKENDKLKNIKLIVADIDGTLLNDDGELNEGSKQLIKELMNEGVVFCLATGRLHSAVTEIAEELSLNGFIISLDGALVKETKNDKTIFESFIKERHVKKAISISEDLLVNIVLCHASSIYYTDSNSIIPSLLSKYGAHYSLVDSYNNYISDTLEIVCSSDVKNSVKYLEERFSFPYAFGCDTSYFRSKKNENIFYLEIRKSGCSKGKAVRRLLKYLSIKNEQTAVIGDWYNDITMFHPKSLKVAMANAIPELHNMADIITEKTNNEDGLAHFFEMILKSKRK
jgi:Cof subfamily protein (haloacid dehalogenase superfamily)